MYGRDPNLSSSLDFQTPVVKFPIIETEYGKELERELRQARQLAKQNNTVSTVKPEEVS